MHVYFPVFKNVSYFESHAVSLMYRIKVMVEIYSMSNLHLLLQCKHCNFWCMYVYRYTFLWLTIKYRLLMILNENQLQYS